MSSTGALNHLSMLRLTRPKAKPNRRTAGTNVRAIIDISRLVLNCEPGFCWRRSAQTLMRVRRRAKAKTRRTRKMKVERVYRSAVWLSKDGLKNGLRLKAACTNTSRASVSRKKPAIYNLGFGGVFIFLTRRPFYTVMGQGRNGGL